MMWVTSKTAIRAVIAAQSEATAKYPCHWYRIPPASAAKPMPICEETFRNAMKAPRRAAGTSSVMSAVSGPCRKAAPSPVAPKTRKSAGPQRKKGTRATARASWMLLAMETVRFPHLSERSEEHTSELQSPCNLVCRLLLEKKKNTKTSGATLTVYDLYAHCSHSVLIATHNH